MTVIKLGHNVYRAYNTDSAMSFLFLVKGESITLKRIDAPKLPETVIAKGISDARFAVKVYLDIHAQEWREQGSIFGSLAWRG
jgi:hypothetical protein